MAGGLQQLRDDLGISLAIETHPVEGDALAHLLADGGDDRAAPCTGRQEDRAIDIKQNQLIPHRASRRRTTTSRSRRLAARVPGPQGSLSTPPQDRVE